MFFMSITFSVFPEVCVKSETARKSSLSCCHHCWCSICMQSQDSHSVQVGVTEGKLRKWLLSVTAFLANQNGSVAEAIALWQRNVQKEFEGVEECLICYSIVSASDGKLPRMHCKTCSKRFHGTCLYKWFQSSGKSNCPHCQSPW